MNCYSPFSGYGLANRGVNVPANSPGQYVFRLRAVYSDSLSNGMEPEITVRFNVGRNKRWAGKVVDFHLAATWGHANTTWSRDGLSEFVDANEAKDAHHALVQWRLTHSKYHHISDSDIRKEAQGILRHLVLETWQLH